jgi:hypothetical protein
VKLNSNLKANDKNGLWLNKKPEQSIKVCLKINKEIFELKFFGMR